MQLSLADSGGMVLQAYKWHQMATSQPTSSTYTQTTVSRSQNCLSALTQGRRTLQWKGPKHNHVLKSLMIYHLLHHTGFSDPSFSTQLPVFGIQGAGVSARGSEDLHRDTASLGGIFNGLVGPATAIITGLSSFHQEQREICLTWQKNPTRTPNQQVSQNQNKKKMTKKISHLAPYIVTSTTVHIPGKQSLGTPTLQRQIDFESKEIKISCRVQIQQQSPKKQTKEKFVIFEEILLLCQSKTMF